MVLHEHLLFVPHPWGAPDEGALQRGGPCTLSRADPNLLAIVVIE